MIYTGDEPDILVTTENVMFLFMYRDGVFHMRINRQNTTHGTALNNQNAGMLKK